MGRDGNRAHLIGRFGCGAQAFQYFFSQASGYWLRNILAYTLADASNFQFAVISEHSFAFCLFQTDSDRSLGETGIHTQGVPLWRLYVGNLQDSR